MALSWVSYVVFAQHPFSLSVSESAQNQEDRYRDYVFMNVRSRILRPWRLSTAVSRPSVLHMTAL